ncbi:MAG: phosphoesterase, partial [Verrucomicrobia bacterium]|nr:phosphoesterase [Verrucomicrobiota bacterium]
RSLKLSACAAVAAAAVAGAAALAQNPNPGGQEGGGLKQQSHDNDQMIGLVRRHIKYVFVLYQENRSFDSYFGTFPGADGLFSHPAGKTPGFYETIVNTNGTTSIIHPFRTGPAEYAADTEDIDHSHPRIDAKMDITNGVPQMDKFALVEERKYWTSGPDPSLKAKQMGELAMAYEDGNTIPFLWRYADRFVLFDHIFQLMTGPSTPGNLSIIAAQTGQTQGALHPDELYPDNGSGAPGVPVLNDDDPYWGSPLDTNPPGVKLPANPGDFPGYGIQTNQTYAALPLSLAGKDAGKMVSTDRDPEGDLDDVMEDVAFLDRNGQRSVPWGWYEEGYDKEPTDPNLGPVDANGTHASYITHHNGPQYFGYVANNPRMSRNLHGLGDFFDAVNNGTLPQDGGVFFVKGGFQNLFGMTPADPDAAVQRNFVGDDDHPGYSDAQISEAMLAKAINAIARSPYWDQCAIIITWDDSEGDYDHVIPPIRSYGPDGSAISDGPRVPLLLISPYARTHYIAHQMGDHGSVVKFVDAVFGLTPLAKLPDEAAGRVLGKLEFGQDNWGPDDALTRDVSDLLCAFDPARLAGMTPPLPASYAIIPDNIVDALPQDGTNSVYGLKQLGITPVDIAKGIPNEIPADFNPRPKTDPTPLP